MLEDCLHDAKPATQLDANEISLGFCLSALRCGDRGDFDHHLNEARVQLLAPLAAASLESYTRAYPMLVRLHMLQELHEASALFPFDGTGDPGNREPHSAPTVQHGGAKKLDSLIQVWRSRLELIQSSSITTWGPVLALRQCILEMHGSATQGALGEGHIKASRLACSAGLLQNASMSLLKAEAASADGVRIESCLLYTSPSPRDA